MGLIDLKSNPLYIYGLLEIVEIPSGNEKLVGTERLLMSNNAK